VPLDNSVLQFNTSQNFLRSMELKFTTILSTSSPLSVTASQFNSLHALPVSRNKSDRSFREDRIAWATVVVLNINTEMELRQ